MTHDLVSAYGMLDKMTVLKPKRTTPEAMTAFHTDEYVHFLRRVTPETVDDLTFHGTRCTLISTLQAIQCINALQFFLVKTIHPLMVSLSFAPFLPADLSLQHIVSHPAHPTLL